MYIEMLETLRAHCNVLQRNYYYRVWSFDDVVRGRISVQPAAHKATSCAVAAVAAAVPPRGLNTQPSYAGFAQTIPRKSTR